MQVQGLEEGLQIRGMGTGGLHSCDAASVGENLGLGWIENNAKGLAKCFEALKEELDVQEGQPGYSVIQVASSGGKRASTIITLVALAAAGTGSGQEVCLKGFEEEVKAESREDGAQGTALGKAFLLDKEVHIAITVIEVALVGRAIQEVKEGEERLESRVASQEISDSSTGAGIEHVGDVQEEEDAVGVSRSVKVAFYVGSGHVQDSI